MSVPTAIPDTENASHYFTVLNSKTRPKDFGQVDFDIHVYYTTLDERAKAMSLREKMRQYFHDRHLFLGEMIDIPVGPHSVPNWEGNFQTDLLPDVIQWLMDNRGEIKILLHKLSGDAFWDHTQGAMFLGDAVSYVNVKFFTDMMKK